MIRRYDKGGHAMLTIVPIPAFDDNYIWLLRNPGSRVAAVVDPGDEEPVLEYLRTHGLELGAILITHRHWDHTGGVQDLLSLFPRIPVFGPAGESIPTVTQALREGDSVSVAGLDVALKTLDVPGHTAGHIAYYGEGALFCGDTLFTAGCGRVFDGTADDLYRSLMRIASLPPATRIYCAHEYTLDNLGFAKWVEPENPALLEREKQDRASRAGDRPTVPSLLGLELATNPFLRAHVPQVIKAAEAYAGRPLQSGAEVFAAVRSWKDRKYD